MAREKLHYCPKEGVKYLKPAHNPTGQLVKVIQENCLIKKHK